jgi:hypothetical protein
MKSLSMAAALSLVLATSVTNGEELKSGLQPGQAIGAFDVLKCAGATDDGVKVGAQLCYRCKYGARPMVMVFSRSSAEPVVKLAKELDAAVAKNSDKQLKAFVNLLGNDREQAEATAKQIGEQNKLANVPVVVPVEFENGPDDYGINPKAEVTVLVAKGGKVTASHAFGKGELNDKTIASVVAETQKLVQE